MKNTASKMFRALCGMVVMLVLVASITSMPVLAAPNGIYIATAIPHYKHPTTGIIEDSGGDGSAALGQSMTESTTHKQALVEVDPDGNTYVTVRLQLMDNIQNPQFQVDGTPVAATLMQENYGTLSKDNTADYRMKVNSENSVIRCNMYVIAMGREVIFYITVSNLQEGRGDFVTSVKVVESEPEPYVPPIPAAAPPPPGPSDTPDTFTTPDTNIMVPDTTATPDVSGTTEPETGETTELEIEETTEAETTEAKTEETAGSTDETGGPVGLQEYDANGNLIEHSDRDETVNADGGSNLGTFGLVFGGVVVVAVSGFGVWYFCFFQKKK